MLFRGWDLLIKDLPEFLQAFFLVTIKVAAIGAICALVLGVLFGLLSSSRHKIIRFISRCYVELFQNTPVLIQVFFVYIGLPYLGFNLDSTIIAVIIISLYHGAYIS
ncbi:MAG: ABC transporter permease subunit, partial [Coprobacillus sp.]|nr:ABC transporter permease subunit [Coprobacillus sp.]